MATLFSREWAMPSFETFTIDPVKRFIRRYLTREMVSADPFARNSKLCRFTNDLNPNTEAKYHMEAIDFLDMLAQQTLCDVILLDPPYSPRQIAECYQQIGKKTTMESTQSSFWTNVKRAAYNALKPNGIILSFGWNSVGMGAVYKSDVLEILLICHGGSHNDTICIAEKLPKLQLEMFSLAFPNNPLHCEHNPVKDQHA